MPARDERRLLEMSDSKAAFFTTRLSVNHISWARERREPAPAEHPPAQDSWQPGFLGASILGSNGMTFAGRLSVITAYLAMAFVGAIVLGMI
ncbi:hypothetical protein ABIE85_004161 [Bradyrhizobium diazoefficiens]|uniref:Uncharacterized protein n=3 Tax=Nitrobacteraceae TaxID=41294 RepID=A0A810AW76_9BRAD|nr:hypothetical protein BD122_12805 [Bradyrhizobium diazoefficiens]KGJ67034.1 hypothetical protein BJA5080_03654 [Bradyrhizobium diazoefficiens SEMIA 5080]BBZ97388.1 hypothetical protein F07S3_72210 [Bradyrhizobium diazoefficiens]BCA06463.1 hypothetical protein H12S4_73670 [Bradyrhizobium diazoefficiens]BCA15073.1 hypothetical protein BDHF08_69200 [Bradyrhizobium diazoefficiens]